MRNTARPFAFLLALGWIAFWGAAIYLMWQPSMQIGLGFQDFDAAAQITTGGLTRILGTLIGVVAIALALPVLVAAFMPQRGRIVERPVDHVAGPTDIDERRKTTELDRKAAADYDSELSALRASVLRHDNEIRQLRSRIPEVEPAVVEERPKAA